MMQYYDGDIIVNIFMEIDCKSDLRQGNVFFLSLFDSKYLKRVFQQ